jgi:hypothetical protein
MLMITFDEAEFGHSGGRVDLETTAATACCDEPSGPNTSLPGLTGAGGGRIGAVILSRYVKPGSRDDTPCNHYTLLRGLEDLFGLDYLGFAKLADPPFDGAYNLRSKGTNQIAVKISAKASSFLDADASRSSSSPAGKVGGLALRAALSARWVDPRHSLP